MAFTPPSSSGATDPYASMSSQQQLPRFPYYDFDESAFLNAVAPPQANDTSTGITLRDIKLAGDFNLDDKFAKLEISDSQTSKAAAEENIATGDDGGKSRISIPIPVPQLPATKMPFQPSSKERIAAHKMKINNMLAKMNMSDLRMPVVAVGEHIPTTGNDKSRISIPNLVTTPSTLPVAAEPLANRPDRDFISHLPSTKTSMKDLQVLWPARVEVSSSGLREILQKNEALEKELSELRPQLKKLENEAAEYMSLSDDFSELQQFFDDSRDENKKLQAKCDKLQDENRRVLKHSKAKTDVLVEILAELRELQKVKVKNNTVENATTNKECCGWGAGGVPLTDTWEAKNEANLNGVSAQPGSQANGGGWAVQGGNAKDDDWNVGDWGVGVGGHFAAAAGGCVQAGGNAKQSSFGGNANGDDWGVGEKTICDPWVTGNLCGQCSRCHGRRETVRKATGDGLGEGQGGDDWGTGQGSVDWSAAESMQTGNGDDWILDQGHTISCSHWG